MTRPRSGGEACAGDAPPPIRIVQVAINVVPERGGTPAAVNDFHRAISGTVVSFTEPELVPAQTEPDVLHVPTLRGAAGRAYGLSASRLKGDADRLLREADLIIVHGLFRYHAQWAWTVARKARVPYWVVPHGVLHPYVFSYRGWQKRPWMRLIGRPMIEGAARTVYATARERETAQRYVRSASASVVHWPMAPVDTSARNEARLRVRGRLGIPADARVLLFLGRIDPVKRVLETIEAFHLCGDERLHLLIVGPESAALTRSACEAYVASLKVPRVHFAPAAYGADKTDVLLASDAFISLSHRENFGYTVAEALAAGLPVVLSPGIDLVPELEGVECGWLLRSFDRDEVVAALRVLARASDDALTRMGDVGRRWAHRNVAPERFATTIRRLASETVAESR